ncbi:HK97 family phage prohead protease [Devosia sp. PTR5]|uniref:HK97 family phage prohead protease n=1 Tax=Devosia oryzisoli TaxID=2774138 RepID=A0A927FUZ5_9HYPH|nr:HK97 family phage prohead protease [Devosia oryzisoli]MBD8065639.1 HK97 family phage prohead protease [Devosia oryzisoli]
MDRAYSLLTVKAVDEEARTIEGWATTPSVDRVGDIIEPLGVKFKNPSPLLWMHRHDQPVGTVNFQRPTKEGVKFTAQLPKVTDAGTFRDRVDEAWHSVRAGVVRAVSIGFRALDGAVEALPGGGARFKRVEVLELSLVSVPANQDATITAVKFYDEKGERPEAPVHGGVAYPRDLPPETRDLIMTGYVEQRMADFRQKVGAGTKQPATMELLMHQQFTVALHMRWQGERIAELERRLGL